MKRHERALGGKPSSALTAYLAQRKAESMEPEPGDLSVMDAAQRIMAQHNASPGTRGYVLYNPFDGERTHESNHPSIGYVAVAAGKPHPRDPLIVEQLFNKIQRARGEQSNPSSGRIF